MATIISRISRDKHVESVSDERQIGDGFWIYLRPGYCNCGTAGGHSEAVCLHSYHEETPTLAYRAMLGDVTACDCQRCVGEAAKRKKKHDETMLR